MQRDARSCDLWCAAAYSGVLWLEILPKYRAFFVLRYRSLITGRWGGGMATKWGNRGSPTQDTVKLLASPLLKGGNFFCPFFSMAKTSSYCVKTTPKPFVSPFSMSQTYSSPPFRRGKTSFAPSSFVAPPPPPRHPPRNLSPVIPFADEFMTLATDITRFTLRNCGS